MARLKAVNKKSRKKARVIDRPPARRNKPREHKVKRKKSPTASEKGLVSPEGWISVQTFARHFEVSEMSVYRLVEADKIPHVRLGRLVRLPKNAIEQYERANITGGHDKVLVPRGTAAAEEAAKAHAQAA